ncbi:MAG: sulfurtransferase TusA family protein [Eubacteriales bacterium]|nr:sulfurtransferase TusA family protein [Eubacteriales bacterium]
MSLIDARGLSCPEPVILLRKAMASKEARYEMLVDNHAAKENTSRYAKSQGYEVTVTETNGEYKLVFKK